MSKFNSNKMKSKLKIPDRWTFKSKNVAEGFDAHVREQLPWYDLATQAVVHIARHYIPRNGFIYDVGASTGNIGNALRSVIHERNAHLVSVEESMEMVANCTAPGVVTCADALTFPFNQFDLCVCFLSIMFFPVPERRKWIANMISKIKPGGAMVIVDKVVTPDGYAGTVLRRMAMDWKLRAGADPEQIIRKELSLAGCQRPMNPEVLGSDAVCFFQVGEFAGWIIERKE